MPFFLFVFGLDCTHFFYFSVLLRSYPSLKTVRSIVTEELIDELSGLANAFIRYARNLAFKIGYMNLRKYARENIRTGIKAIDDKIANWGLQEGQSFVINQGIDDKLEKITETNPDLGNFLEGLKEGALDGFNEFVVMT